MKKVVICHQKSSYLPAKKWKCGSLWLYLLVFIQLLVTLMLVSNFIKLAYTLKY